MEADVESHHTQGYGEGDRGIDRHFCKENSTLEESKIIGAV